MNDPPTCPECGATLRLYYKQPTLAYPECWVWECEECEYREDPQ